MSWSFLFSVAEFAECIDYDPKFVEVSLKVQYSRNVIKLRLFLQRILQNLDLLRSKSSNSPWPASVLSSPFRVVISSAAFSDFLFEEHVYQATERFPPNKWRGCSFPCQLICFLIPLKAHRSKTLFLLLKSFNLLRHSEIILELITSNLSDLMTAWISDMIAMFLRL